MPTNHGVTKKTPPSVYFHLPPPYLVFTRFVCCFTTKTLSTFLCSDQIICERKCIFKVKQFFLAIHWWSVLILLLSLYLHFRALFYSSAIMKIRINNLFFAWLSIWALIKSCCITKEFMVWKLQAVHFSVSEETKFEVDTISTILSYLYNLGDVKK